MKEKRILWMFIILITFTMLTACQSVGSTASDNMTGKELTNVSIEERNSETSEFLTGDEVTVFTAGDLSILLHSDYTIKQHSEPRADADLIGVGSADNSERIILLFTEYEVSVSNAESRQLWSEIAAKGMMENIESSGGSVVVESEADLTEVYFANRVWAHKSITMNIDGKLSVYDSFVSVSRKEGILRSIEIINYDGGNQKLVNSIGDIVSISKREDKVSSENEFDSSSLSEEGLESELEEGSVEITPGIIAISENKFIDYLEDYAPQQLLENFNNLFLLMDKTDIFADCYIAGYLSSSDDYSATEKHGTVMIYNQNQDIAAFVDYIWNQGDELVLYTFKDPQSIEPLILLSIMSVDS